MIRSNRPGSYELEDVLQPRVVVMDWAQEHDPYKDWASFDYWNLKPIFIFQ